MLNRFRGRLLLVAAVLSVVAGFGASAAQAVPAPTDEWVTYSPTTFTRYITNCNGSTGTVLFKLQWERYGSDRASSTKFRLNRSYDIKIVNNSTTSVRIGSNPGSLPGQISWRRGHGDLIASAYNYTFAVAPGDTGIVSVDNPDRWERIDGVPDSDPSPYGTPLAYTSDPYVDFSLPTYCGSTEKDAAVASMYNPYH